MNGFIKCIEKEVVLNSAECCFVCLLRDYSFFYGLIGKSFLSENEYLQVRPI